MAVNQQNPNPNNIAEEIASITRIMENSVDAIEDLSLQSLYSLSTNRTPVGKYLKERATLLRGLVNEIDRPILKALATDMLNTMSSWFNDPEVLCCLINAIWTAYAESKNKDPNKPPENYHLEIADSKFGEFLDHLISFIDFIIVLLTNDLKKIVLFIPDFIKGIFSGMMGAILLVLQEILYIIRDSIIQSMLDWVDENTNGNMLWAKCLPFQQFLDILKKYVHDYGLFAQLMEKIRGFISGKKSAFDRAAEVIPNAKDLAFLYWFRDLLIRLKRAVVNFDLCIEHAYIPDNNYVADGIRADVTSTVPPGETAYKARVNPDASAKDKVPAIVGDDGRTILLSENARQRMDRKDNNQNGNNGRYVSRISNNAIAAFLKNNYNFSDAIVEQALMNSSDGCPGFPGGQDLKDYLMKIRNRK